MFRAISILNKDLAVSETENPERATLIREQ